MENKIKELKELYNSYVEEYEDIDWEAAPSGEFAEYNVEKLGLQQSICALQEVFDIFEIEYEYIE